MFFLLGGPWWTVLDWLPIFVFVRVAQIQAQKTMNHNHNRTGFFNAVLHMPWKAGANLVEVGPLDLRRRFASQETSVNSILDEFHDLARLDSGVWPVQNLQRRSKATIFEGSWVKLLPDSIGRKQASAVASPGNVRFLQVARACAERQRWSVHQWWVTSAYCRTCHRDSCSRVAKHGLFTCFFFTSFHRSMVLETIRNHALCS